MFLHKEIIQSTKRLRRQHRRGLAGTCLDCEDIAHDFSGTMWGRGRMSGQIAHHVAVVPIKDRETAYVVDTTARQGPIVGYVNTSGDISGDLERITEMDGWAIVSNY